MHLAHANPHWFCCLPVVFVLAICSTGASHSNRLLLAAEIYKADYG